MILKIYDLGFSMTELNNEHIVKLIEKILDEPGELIPRELTYELVDYFADATLVSPVDENDNIIMLQLGPRNLLPACCDIGNFKNIFKDNKHKLFTFDEYSKFLTPEMDGIIINPGSFGFICNLALSMMVFRKIEDNCKDPVKKGYDVKVRLNDFRPLTWRDLIIPEKITFDELDNILKTLWGFAGYHLSAFLIKKDNLLIMDGDMSDECMMNADFDANFDAANG